MSNKTLLLLWAAIAVPVCFAQNQGGGITQPGAAQRSPVNPTTLACTVGLSPSLLYKNGTVDSIYTAQGSPCAYALAPGGSTTVCAGAVGGTCDALVIAGGNDGLVTSTASGAATGVATIGTGLDFTSSTLTLKPPTLSVIGGVQAINASTHLWIDAISTLGVPHQSQPAAADLSNGVSGTGTVILQTSPNLITPTIGGAAITYATTPAATGDATFNVGSGVIAVSKVGGLTVGNFRASSLPGSCTAGTSSTVTVNTGGADAIYACDNTGHYALPPGGSTTVLAGDTAGPAATNAVIALSNANTLFGSTQTGANAGAKIAAAITALPAGGGTVDATGLIGAQTIATDIFTSVTKAVSIKFGKGTYAFSANTSIPANVTFTCESGALLSPATSTTLTIAAPSIKLAETQPCFDTTAAGTFNILGNVSAGWFTGVDPINGADSTAGISKAAASQGGTRANGHNVISLPFGQNYRVSGVIPTLSSQVIEGNNSTMVVSGSTGCLFSWDYVAYLPSGIRNINISGPGYGVNNKDGLCAGLTDPMGARSFFADNVHVAGFRYALDIAHGSEEIKLTNSSFSSSKKVVFIESTARGEGYYFAGNTFVSGGDDITTGNTDHCFDVATGNFKLFLSGGTKVNCTMDLETLAIGGQDVLVSGVHEEGDIATQPYYKVYNGTLTIDNLNVGVIQAITPSYVYIGPEAGSVNITGGGVITTFNGSSYMVDCDTATDGYLAINDQLIRPGGFAGIVSPNCATLNQNVESAWFPRGSMNIDNTTPAATGKWGVGLGFSGTARSQITSWGNIETVLATQPTGVAVTPTGGAARNNTYLVIGTQGDGSTIMSAAVPITNGPTTFGVSNFNTITWANGTNYNAVRIYCSVGCSPTGYVSGLLAPGATSFEDVTGIGNGSALPANNTGLFLGHSLKLDTTDTITAGTWSRTGSLFFNASATINFQQAGATKFTISTDTLLPVAANTQILGSSTLPFKNIFVASHVGSGTATFAPQAGAGSGATAVCATSHLCDSFSGEVTLTSGAVPAIGSDLIITLPITRTNLPNCAVEIKGGTLFLGDTKTVTTSTITISTGAALAAATAYTINYVCGGN